MQCLEKAGQIIRYLLSSSEAVSNIAMLGETDVPSLELLQPREADSYDSNVSGSVFTIGEHKLQKNSRRALTGADVGGEDLC